jgi:hypothetical protein
MAGAVVVALASLVFAQKPDNKGKGRNNDEKRENQRVDEARDALQSARQALQQAERDVDKAEQEFKTAARHVQSVEAAARAKHADDPPVARAKDARVAAKAGFERLQQPLLENLQATGEYQAAVQQASAARKRLEEMRGETTLTVEERARKVKEQQQLAGKPALLEQAVIDADPDAKAAQEQLKLADHAFARANQARDEKIEQDPELKQARSKFEAAKRNREKLQAAVVRARQQAEQASQRLASAVAADQRDDNQKNTKGKGKPKGKGN